MFKGDFADMCAEKNSAGVSGGGAACQACTDGERGPQSAPAKFCILFLCIKIRKM